MLGAAPKVVPPPVVAESPTPPKILEYTPPTTLDRWQVERYEDLAVFLAFKAPWAETMVRFHGFAEADTQRWFYVRRLFGIQPLIPAADAHPDDLKIFTQEELCTATGLKPEQLVDELTHLRVAWEAFQTEVQRAVPLEPVSLQTVAGRELPLSDSLLERFDFDKSLFDVMVYDPAGVDFKYKPRTGERNRLEMEWFIAKLMRPEWQKMLDDPMAGTLARSALVNELYLRRFDKEMMGLMPTSPTWKEMSGSRAKIEEQYGRQMSDLSEKFPELGVAGRVSFRAVVSDLNAAHRQYYGKRDRRLWDKVHTSAEIVFLTRTSAQLPVPRYRLGWQVAVVEAMHGLYDPNFRSQLKKNDLKKLDLGFRRGVEEAKRETGEVDVDLERGVIPGEPGTDEFEDYLANEKLPASPEKSEIGNRKLEMPI